HLAEERLVLAKQEHASEDVAVLPVSEPLLADEVRDARRCEPVERLLGGNRCSGLDIADVDDEAVADEMPPAKLVAMPVAEQHAHLRMMADVDEVAVELVAVRRADRKPLPRDRVLVLEPRVADVAPADIERLRDAAH